MIPGVKIMAGRCFGRASMLLLGRQTYEQVLGFGGLPAEVNLEHLDIQSFDSGVVRSNYAVRKSG